LNLTISATSASAALLSTSMSISSSCAYVFASATIFQYIRPAYTKNLVKNLAGTDILSMEASSQYLLFTTSANLFNITPFLTLISTVPINSSQTKILTF
jgi:hypothetical protein